jgi:hypothetical protein
MKDDGDMATTLFFLFFSPLLLLVALSTGAGPFAYFPLGCWHWMEVKAASGGIERGR